LSKVYSIPIEFVKTKIAALLKLTRLNECFFSFLEHIGLLLLVAKTVWKSGVIILGQFQHISQKQIIQMVEKSTI